MVESGDFAEEACGWKGEGLLTTFLGRGTACTQEQAWQSLRSLRNRDHSLNLQYEVGWGQG